MTGAALELVASSGARVSIAVDHWLELLILALAVVVVAWLSYRRSIVVNVTVEHPERDRAGGELEEEE